MLSKSIPTSSGETINSSSITAETLAEASKILQPTRASTIVQSAKVYSNASADATIIVDNIFALSPAKKLKCFNELINLSKKYVK